MITSIRYDNGYGFLTYLSVWSHVLIHPHTCMCLAFIKDSGARSCAIIKVAYVVGVRVLALFALDGVEIHAVDVGEDQELARRRGGATMPWLGSERLVGQPIHIRR